MEAPGHVPCVPSPKSGTGTVCCSLGRWHGCLQCGQSIVCLSLFRGHTCVCRTCWMPE